MHNTEPNDHVSHRGDPDPLVVVHLTGAELGGAEKQLVTLLTHAAGRSAEQRTAHGRPIEHRVVVTRPGPLVDSFRALVPTVVLDKQGKVDPAFMKGFRDAIITADADIVHTWAFTPNQWGPLVAKSIPHPPKVVMAEVGLEEWKGRASRLGDQLSYRCADAVVGCVEEVTRTAVRRGASLIGTETIYLGVETGPRPERDPEPGTVLLLGRIDWRKGHKTLLEAWRTVVAAHPEARLTLAGPAAAEEELALKAELEATIAADPELARTVTMLGRVDPAPHLARTAVLAMPSTSEGLPNVLLEAYSQAVPVVASAVGGIPDIMIDGENGWLVPSEDPAALAAALIDALDHPDEARRRGFAGRDTVEPLTVEASLDQWENLYRRLTAPTTKDSQA